MPQHRTKRRKIRLPSWPEVEAKRLASSLALFFLADHQRRDNPRWTFYDKDSGKPVFDYWLRSGFWRSGTRDGRVADHNVALAILRRLAGHQRPSDATQSN